MCCPAWFLARLLFRKHGVVGQLFSSLHTLQTHSHTSSADTLTHPDKCQHKLARAQTYTCIDMDNMAVPRLPSRTRSVPAEFSRPAQVAVGEAAIVQNNYPVITSISPSDKSFAAFCRLHRRPSLFVRLEVITAVV